MIGIVVFVILFFFQSGSAQYAIPRSVFGSGGGTASSATHKILGTLGQPFIGATSSATSNQNAGFWYVHQVVTAVHDERGDILPAEYRLEQNYPNPFNPSTTIEFALPEQSEVSLKLYNVLGEEVGRLMERTLPAGYHKVQVRAQGLSSGVYLYRLEAKSERSGRTFTMVKKLTCLR